MDAEIDGSGDELPLLPRNTKVQVKGNNRTKSSLVGKKGTVMKAIGLGGWHWLKLADGKEVRIQRNALYVLEQPAGNEMVEDDEIESVLTDDNDEIEDVAKTKTNYRYDNYRGNKDATQKKRNEMKENSNAGSRSKRDSSKNEKETKEEKEVHEREEKRKGSKRSRAIEAEPGVSFRRKSDRKKEQERLSSTGTRVNFAKLETAALRKYKSHYKLPDSGVDTKDQLVSTVTSHFRQYHVDEKRVIARFIQTTAMRTWRNSNT